jgi:hypothetical protein
MGASARRVPIKQVPSVPKRTRDRSLAERWRHPLPRQLLPASWQSHFGSVRPSNTTTRCEHTSLGLLRCPVRGIRTRRSRCQPRHDRHCTLANTSPIVADIRAAARLPGHASSRKRICNLPKRSGSSHRERPPVSPIRAQMKPKPTVTRLGLTASRATRGVVHRPGRATASYIALPGTVRDSLRPS